MNVTETLFYLDQHYSDEWQRLAALIPAADDIRRRVEALDWWPTKPECLECLDVARASLNPDTSRITVDQHFNRFDWIRDESNPNDQCFLAAADPRIAPIAGNIMGLAVVTTILSQNGSSRNAAEHLHVTTTTPPPAGTTEPPKPVRNAKLANDLLFQAQNATTLEQGQAVLKTATEALKAGTINDDDRGRIRAALDSVAFQNGYLDKIDTAGLGQNAVATKPGAPTPGRISSVSDAGSALSSQAVPPPSQIFGTGSTNLDQIAGDLKPQPPQVAISIGDISGTNQDEIVTTVFAKLETQMRSGMSDAGIPA